MWPDSYSGENDDVLLTDTVEAWTVIGVIFAVVLMTMPCVCTAALSVCRARPTPAAAAV